MGNIIVFVLTLTLTFISGIIIWWELVLDQFFLYMFFYRTSLCCICHCSDHESIVNVEFFSSTLSMHREPVLLWQRQFSFLRCKEVGNDDCEKPSKSCKEKYFPDLRQVLQSLRRIECWEKAKCFPYILVRSNKSVQSVWHHYKIVACSWNLLPASPWKSMLQNIPSLFSRWHAQTNVERNISAREKKPSCVFRLILFETLLDD